MKDKPKTGSPSTMLVGLSVGLGIGLAIAAANSIDSLLIKAVVAASVAGGTSFAIYHIGLRLTDKNAVR